MPESIMHLCLADEHETEALGKQFAKSVHFPFIIFLEGDLGAGKTTWVRGFLKGMGYSGNVKSPTYTLVEIYPFVQGTVYHFDLYRIMHPEELEFIGISEYFEEKSIALIEWPQQGIGLLPKADLRVELKPSEKGRVAILEFLSPKALDLQKQFCGQEKRR